MYHNVQHKNNKKLTKLKPYIIRSKCEFKFSSTAKVGCERTVTNYKRVEIYKDVTYYRSRVREYISGSIDYKWSRSQNDISLIKKGYTLTGKSRVVE